MPSNFRPSSILVRIDRKVLVTSEKLKSTPPKAKHTLSHKRYPVTSKINDLQHVDPPEL